MTGDRVRMSSGDAVVVHVTSLVLTGGVMWVLHTGDHSSGVVLGVSLGVYAAVLAGMLAIGRARARRRDERQRANYDADIAERNRRLYGSG
jgi:hypothetical protein